MELADFLQNDEFKNDPLFLLVLNREDLEEDPPFLKELEVGESYTTRQAEAWLGKSDANLRYYLRELESYIGVTRSGRNYRLDAYGMYRLYLICTLIDNGFFIQDIAMKLGLTQEVSKVKHNIHLEKYSDDKLDLLFKAIQDNDEKLKEIVHAHQLELKYLKLQQKHLSDISKIEHEIQCKRIEINSLEEMKSNIKLFEEQTSKTMDIINKVKEKRSFWSTLFQKKEQLSEIPFDNSSFQKKIEEIENKIVKKKEEIKNLENKKEVEEKRLLELTVTKEIKLQHPESSKDDTKELLSIDIDEKG